MNCKEDFGDLSDDRSIQNKITNFRNSVAKIENIVQFSSDPELYEKLSKQQKVDFDLFMAYTLNTLFWLYMKTRGEDPNKSELKNQLLRVREYMVKSKETSDRVNRPRVDTAVAGRFIKHGIHYREGADVEDPPNKRIKFSD